MRKNVQNFGQNLKTFAGVEEVITATGALKKRNVWENHGLFLSRSIAQGFAQKNRPGKKYHISGVRIDVTEMEPPRRELK